MPERAMEQTAAAVKRPMRTPEPAPHAVVRAPAPVRDAAGAHAPGAPSAVLVIQRAAGNQAVMRMLDAQRPGHSLAGPSTAVQRLSEDELDDEDDVQRSAAALHEPSDNAIRSAAAEGVRTPSTTLPHLDRIQASFGRHSIAHVQAHVGSEAARASRAMNAVAYASGNHVVFGATPDLRTAAHEAAHIVQQQAGVQLSGGIGRHGDPYERHADAVADAVVAGRSAETLLLPLGGITSKRTSVQRMEPAGSSILHQVITTVLNGIDDTNDQDGRLREPLEILRKLLHRSGTGEQKAIQNEFPSFTDSDVITLNGIVAGLQNVAMNGNLPADRQSFTNAIAAKSLGGRGLQSILQDASTALKVIWEIESSTVSTGFRNLKVSKEGGIEGRPDFPDVTKEQVKTVGKQHRRHILAWHTISAFVDMAYNAYPDAVAEIIKNYWGTIESDSGNPSTRAFVQAHGLFPKDPATLTTDEWVKMGLYVMNGNPRNLWAGEGKDNSTSNSVYQAMEKSLAGINDINGLRQSREKWNKIVEKKKHSAIYQATAEVFVCIIDYELRLRGKAVDNGPCTPETGPATMMEIEGDEEPFIDRIRKDLHSILVTLDVDRWSSEKFQTEIAQNKFADLGTTIIQIYTIVQDKKIPSLDVVSPLIKKFLTYA